MSRHDELVEAAKTAIDTVHSDTSVSLQETLMSLRDLGGHIDTLIDAVEQSVPDEEEE